MKISAYFNPKIIDDIKGCYLVIDTNILTSCASNNEYFDLFLDIFKYNYFLIDPIVKLEFIRGASGKLFEDKNKFLEFDKFQSMLDHYDIYRKVYANTFVIAKIYANCGNPNIPLGDLFIVSRLMVYDRNYLFVTLDKSDFSTVLFDRVGVVSIERKSGNKNRQIDIIDHISLLRFNEEKYKICLSKIS